MDHGRLLKKEKIENVEGVEIEEYRFLDLGPEDVALADNPRRSLLYTHLHTKAELEEKIRIPSEFRQVLRPKNKALVPEDLTEDYLRSQEELVLKKRRKLLDEDEAVALELAEMMEKSAGITNGANWRTKERGGGEPAPEPGGDGAESREAPPPSAPKASLPSRGVEAKPEPPPAALREEASVPPPAVVIPEEEAVPGRVEISESELEELKKAAWEEAWQAGFAEGKAEGLAQGSQEGRESGHQEGQALGYEEGFREGEIRGEFAGEAKVAKIVDMLAEVVNHMGHLRSEILASGQEIFIEFTKTACEGILKAQLSVSDETLRRFLIQTMSPFVERSFLVVEVHPSDAARVSGVLAARPELAKKVRVKENLNMTQGDFRVEADNEVVVVDLQKAVTNFIDEIKGEILVSETPARGKESA